jgi:hypothetical protein
LRSARLHVDVTGSPINYANRLIGSPITSQSTGQGATRGKQLLIGEAAAGREE